MRIRNPCWQHFRWLNSGVGGSEANSLESRSVAPSIIFPHLGAGGPLTTQIILINPVSESLRGRIRLTSSDGNPLELQLDGIAGSDFPYDLAPDGVFQATLTSDSGGFAGYATVTVEEGSGSPAGTAIFQFREPGGNLVSEAGVGAGLTTTLARIFVDNVDTQTGVAVASPGNPSAEVTFRLLDLTGRQLGVVRRILPEAGHLAVFADELFPDLTDRLTGVLEIASEVPFMPITLKLTVNERGDLILTTLPVADLTRPRPTGLLVFPQVGFGLGFYDPLHPDQCRSREWSRGRSAPDAIVRDPSYYRPGRWNRQPVCILCRRGWGTQTVCGGYPGGRPDHSRPQQSSRD